MKRRWMLALCLWLLAGGARGEEYWLRYRFSANVNREIVNTGSQSASVKPLGLPEGWTAPAEAIDPLGHTITMGTGEASQFRLLFTRTKKDGPRDRLWVSRDGDWAKADAYPSVVMETSYYKATPFGPVRFKLAGADGETDYHALIVLTDSDPKYANVIVQTSCYYEDKIELEGKTRRVALVDANANGRFGDVGASLRDCDWLMIDMDGDGNLNAYGPDYKEVFSVGKYVKFGEKLYALTVAPDGASFTLEPATCPTGKIRVKSEGKQFKAILFGENGRLTLDGKGGEVTAPCGDYKLVQAEFSEPGADEQTRWVLSGGAMDAKAAPVSVAKDKTAELTIGPPLTAKVEVQKSGTQYTVNLKLTGQAGEEYTVRKGMNNPTTAPKLKVQREGASGEPETFSFEYG